MACRVHMHTPRAHRRPAFTLIELLVVIAIVAILAALMVSGLSAARSRARLVACASNLRSIGQAVMLYATEHDGRLPPVAAVDGTIWDTALLPYLGNNSDVFLCRDDPWLAGRDPTRSPRSYAANGGVAYSPHTEAQYPFGGYRMANLQTIENLRSRSQRLILVGERPGDGEGQRGYVGELGWSGMDSIPGRTHHQGEGANYLFADMGVEYMATGDAFYAENDFWYVSSE